MNPEYEKYTAKENKSEDKTASNAAEAGFSEKDLDLDVEVRAGEWQNLRKFHAFKRISRQGKIIAMYHAVSNRLNQLVVLYYKFVSIEPKKAEKMLEELRKLRYMQEVLLNCLVWEPAGKLDRDMVPKDVWDLIE